MSLPRTDVSGIVYIIENAQQFWSELEDILNIPDKLTLSRLDATLRQCISFCAAYHEQYLQSPLQLQHACDLLLASELFTFHSERMSEILTDDAQTSTDPHVQYILYSILHAFGRRNAAFIRSQKRWEPLLPLLMDHVLLDIDPDIDDTFLGSVSGTSSGIPRGVSVPIEAKLRSLSVRLLYEVCRVQKLSLQELRVFDDTFISHLFDLVEQTRDSYDETFNYSVIKLIVALNEQFMVACLPPPSSPVSTASHESHRPHRPPPHEGDNRILRTLMSRLSCSPTFGENLIFMLNRADRTDEDLCMQLLVLKLLYLLFTTKGTSEYFYTNDLCVLVDVFLREILNLDEENESLRHTYLRVLHPLLTKTQLRDIPYKRPQIARVLESLIANESIRDVDPTTKRLVQRCLSGEWCVQFRKSAARQNSMSSDGLTVRTDSPGLSSDPPQSADVLNPPPLNRNGSVRGKSLKTHRSAENLNASVAGNPRGTLPHRASVKTGISDNVRHVSNGSSASLPRVAIAAASPASRRRDRAGSVEVEATTTTFSSLAVADQRHPQHILDQAGPFTHEPTLSLGTSVDVLATPHIRVQSSTPISEVPDSPMSISSSSSTRSAGSNTKARRAPPAPPPKRRKPPAIPAARSTYMSLTAASSQPSLTPLTMANHKGSSY